MDSEQIPQTRLQDIEDLAREAIEIGNENNRLIRRMIRMGRIAFWSKAVVWAIVLGLPILFWGSILSVIQSHTGGTSLFGYPSPEAVQQFLGHSKGS